MLSQSISKSISEVFRLPNKKTVTITFSHYHTDMVTVDDSKEPISLFVYGVELPDITNPETLVGYRTNLKRGESLSDSTSLYNPNNQTTVLFSDYPKDLIKEGVKPYILEINPALGIDTKTLSYYFSNLVSKAADTTSGGVTVGRDITLDVLRNNRSGKQEISMISQDAYDFLYSFAWGQVSQELGHSAIPAKIEAKIAIQTKINSLSGVKSSGNLLALAGLQDLGSVFVDYDKTDTLTVDVEAEATEDDQTEDDNATIDVKALPSN